MNAPVHTHFGRYRVVREIGRGAMGIVYEAQDETLGRPVAVKTMMMSDDPQERTEHEARFLQEAKAAGGLNHANIITIHDMGREGDWLYIAMELLEGVELRELMRNGSLSLPMSLDLIAQVALGLAVAHQRGIVHRDIKPANIMVLPGNRAKIMDFGVARVHDSAVKTKTGVMLGSPKYMSPEQVEGQGIDYRSDIFSLGSVLYEMVTGVAPFSGNDLGSLLFDIMRASPQPASARNPEVPPALDEILAKALTKAPGARYQDANEMAHDLLQCVAQITGTPSATRSFAASGFASSRPMTEADMLRTSRSGSDLGDKTVVQGRGDEEATQVQPREKTRSRLGASTGTTAFAASSGYAGVPVSPQFDSQAALRRLEQLGTGAAQLRARTPAGESRPWGWWVAYGVAAVAAVAIALV